MKNHAVVIAGGGPTGMMLAAELALAKVDVAIVERRETQEIESSRAGGLHARTIEVLDQRGIAERFISQGKCMQFTQFALPIDLSDFPSRHNYGLALWQRQFERILGAWVSELPVHIYRGREVVGLVQDEAGQAGVDVALAGGETVHAQYLVGCDGGRSVIRKAAGIDFPGWEATTSWLISEMETSEEPALGVRHDAKGTHGIGRLEDGKLLRAVVTEEALKLDPEPTFEEFKAGLRAIYGSDFGAHSPRWLSRFTDVTRQAATYRKGRVLLAGDAAHVHPPQGGQGLNIGLQDAVNLGWKLAQVVSGLSPDSLLDTYQAERHPVAARVLKGSLAQAALRRPDDRTKALEEFCAELLRIDEARKYYAGRMSGLDVHYDLGNGHPLLGRRMPDLDLIIPLGPRSYSAAEGAPIRVFTLLHDARPILLNLGAPGAFDIAAWRDRVQLIDAQYTGVWELPVIGAVTAPSAVLIRPDGHVAWTSDGSAGTDEGLRDALTKWFGPPTAS